MKEESEMPVQPRRYEKPQIRRVALDIRASTLGVQCWNSNQTATSNGDGCTLPLPNCAP